VSGRSERGGRHRSGGGPGGDRFKITGGPVFAGRLSEVTDPSQWAAGSPTSSRWVVVAYPAGRRCSSTRMDFARWLETTLGRRSGAI